MLVWRNYAKIAELAEKYTLSSNYSGAVGSIIGVYLVIIGWLLYYVYTK